MNDLPDLLQQWNLDEKNHDITTDNGANIKKACQENKWVNIPCFGHNLHIAITNSLAKEPKLSRAIGVCKKGGIGIRNKLELKGDEFCKLLHFEMSQGRK